ncbi:carboxypeptidase-like regulatory domain-containing protein [Kiritimatiella glycovorans]|uniref:Carboxypeptidase regulatory-like domain-containing protein n=1 Tax=Kiritimatiella glycovorans TaxID=1307763 RepID=A0A0G3ELT7_9BACT|nr:carboxypeptidase-like regulatory domain-containing protein [Kiritimatiella glycovorans]AKJ65129.1 hypothetical protein L21SP4_01893 [Kiritimatiella glycovorans]
MKPETVWISILILFLFVSGAAAHRIHVFASREGPNVEGRVYSSSGRGIRADVRLYDAADDLAARTQTSENGTFRFDGLDTKVTRVEAVTDDGHRAERALNPVPGGAPSESAVSAPEQGIRLRDVIAGLGTIAGLAGLAHFWSTRRRARGGKT